MILAALGGEALGLAAIAVPLRAAWYAASLGAAGMAFFALLFAPQLEPAEAMRLRHWASGTALLGLLIGAAGLAVQVAALTDGEALLDAEVWTLVLASQAGLATGAGAAGLLAVALLGFGPLWAGAAAFGGLVVCASHALAGHTTRVAPWPLLAALLTVHLLVAAFWTGSLLPLAWAARRDGVAAASLIEVWARLAVLAVPALLLAGLLLAVLLLGGVGPLVATPYGWALLAKVALVAALLGLAAWHRWRLTPALVRGDPGAGRRLARSIAVEAVVTVLVLYATAELVSTSPGKVP